MKKVFVFLCMIMFAYAQPNFSEPKPSFDEPRKVVFQINDSDVKKVNHNLSTIYNILKQYPEESLKVVVVTYGNGTRMLKKDYDKKTLVRVQSLMEYDVEFIACKNTMDTMKWTKKDFIEDIEYVQAGIVELIERQVAGYIGILAY